MKRALLLALLAVGCTSDTADRDLALAEAQARTAEAEARAAEARATEAVAQAETSTAAPAPSAAPAPAPAARPAEEATIDYDPFGRPQSAYVQTQTAGQITLRDAPRAGARRVVRIVDGTQVSVLGCKAEATVRTDAAAAGTPGRWCYVRTGTHDGWAFDAYLVF